MSDSSPVPLRAAVVAVQLPGVDDQAFAASLAELRRLGRTLGVDVVATVTQRRKTLHPAALLGSGKLAELQALAGRTAAEIAGEEDDDGAVEASADDDDDTDASEDDAGTFDDGPPGAAIQAVLVDHDISPSQARNLEKATGVEVLDRTAVILEIFRRHARSRAAKAQVEIVRLQYMVPRLRESGKGKDRQRGGIGGKGAGESSLELDRRKIRDRIAELTRELEALAVEQQTQRARRRDMSRVALVGYTNAGKSTLMRALTGSEVYVADRLFATLDTTVRPLVPATRPRVLLSDTVGFIDKLPHGLVNSFKSTLDEALEAGLLCQVVDASDPELRAPAGGDDRGAGRDRRRRRAAAAAVQQDRSGRQPRGRGDVPARAAGPLARRGRAFGAPPGRRRPTARPAGRLLQSRSGRGGGARPLPSPADARRDLRRLRGPCGELRRRGRHLPRPRPPRDARAAQGGGMSESDSSKVDSDSSDEVVRCVLEGLPVRIVAATTTAAVREAVRRHQAGPAATLALARGLSAGLLLATLTKDDERVTLQILGDGPLGGVTVDATAAGTVRAYVKHPSGGLKPLGGGRPSLAAAVGRTGLVNVIRDVGLGEPFSGQIAPRHRRDRRGRRGLSGKERTGGERARMRHALRARTARSTSPPASSSRRSPAARAPPWWRRPARFIAGGEFLRALAGARRDGEGVVAAVLGDRLGKVQVLDRRPVRFDCPCSRARAGTSLALLGESELAAMILDDGKAEVTCNFCRARYEFDEAELEILRRETAKPTGPPS